MTLKLNGSTAGSVSIDAPADTSPTGTDVTLTLPTSAGSSGQYLQTNGSGTLSWQTVEGLPDAIDVNASAPADSVNLDGSGRLGVGTTSPDDALHVLSSDGNLRIDTSTNAGSASLLFDVPASNGLRASGHRAEIACEHTGFGWGSNLVFYGGTTDTTPTELMRITDTGSLRFGQTTTNTPCQSATAGIALNANGHLNAWRDGSSAAALGRAQDGVVVQWYRGGSQVGTVTVAAGSTAYNTTSDYRLKENIVPLTGAADRLNQLQVRRFNFIADPDTTVDGFIAHEAQAVVPEAVTGTHNEIEVWKEGEELPDGVLVGDNKLDEDGNTIPVYQGIDQSKLVPLLTAALQEALAKIETLETRLTALEGGAS